MNCIKYDGPPIGQDGEQVMWLAYRLHYENLVPGIQLIVNRNQESVLFHHENVFAVFGPGVHTLSVADIPFGVRSPISVEIYFVNKMAKLDVEWGTFKPLQITDPIYQITLRVRAYGQFTIRILNSRNFISQIAAVLYGNQLLDYQTVSKHLKRLAVTKVKDTIADMMINKKTSIEDIMTSVDSVSIVCRKKVATEFDRLGIAALSFLIESINVPEEDMALVREMQKEKVIRPLQPISQPISFNVGGDFAMSGSTISMGGIEEVNSVRRCPECNRERQQGDRYCPECGTML